MTSSPRQRSVPGPAGERPRAPRGPWLVLAIGLASSLAATALYVRLVQVKDEERFDNSVTQVTDTIQDRFAVYDALMRGVVGLYTARENVRPAEFAAYVERLGIGDLHRGIRGIGFVERVASADRAGFEQRQRAYPGRETFAIKGPEREGEEIFPITHVEPADPGNLFALGYDVYGEARRRAAMDAARDAGEARATGTLTLIQELDGETQPGFAIYYPVYARAAPDGGPPATLAERRESLVGFVYAPFRAVDFLRSVFGTEAHPRVDFDVYDGEGAANLLYRSGAHDEYDPRHEEDREFRFAGRTWRIAFRTRPDFELASGRPQVPLLLAAGVAISFLLFRISRAQARARADAERSAASWARAEERFATTLASIGDGVIATDRALRITFVNPVAEALTGWSAADAVGRDAHEVFRIVDEATGEALESPVERALREDRVVTLPRRARLVRRDGSSLAIEDSAAPIRDARGALEGIVLVWRDVGERRRVEAELARHRERLEDLVAERTRALEESHQRLRLSERMASLGTLSAGLGHDMGNLLLPVRIRLESLASADLPAEAQAEIAVIRRCVEYLQRLSNGLRLFALDPSEAASAAQATDLADWWSDVEPFFKSVLPRGVALESRIPRDLAPVRIARHALTQAVFNLVQNAGDVMRARGRGRLEVFAEHDRATDRIRIGVADDGPGMTREVRQRCLEPFFTTKAREISTGLGLALVHGIVQKAGGTLEVESEEGRGTTIVIAVAAARERTPRDSGDARARPVAVVDVGDARIASFLRKELDEEGFEVRTAAAGLDDARFLAVDEPRCDARAVARFLAGGEGRGALVFGAPDGLVEDERAIRLPRQLKPTAIRDAIRRLARSGAESAGEAR